MKMPQINLSKFQIQILQDLTNFYLQGANGVNEKDMADEEKQSAKIIDNKVRNIKDILENSISF